MHGAGRDRKAVEKPPKMFLNSRISSYLRLYLIVYYPILFDWSFSLHPLKTSEIL